MLKGRGGKTEWQRELSQTTSKKANVQNNVINRGHFQHIKFTIRIFHICFPSGIHTDSS